LFDGGFTAGGQTGGQCSTQQEGLEFCVNHEPEIVASKWADILPHFVGRDKARALCTLSLLDHLPCLGHRPKLYTCL
jgi:hypothetical protein